MRVKINSRDKIIYKNVSVSFLFKGINLFLSFLLIRVSLNFLNTNEYGIWLTIASILNWVTLFDLGFGNGLRNKLGEAIAGDDVKNAKTYVSTAYYSLFCIFSAVVLIVAPVLYMINWARVLNFPVNFQYQVKCAIVIAFVGICISFTLKLLTVVLLSYQRSAIPEIINVAVQLLILLCIVASKGFFKGSILVFAIIYSVVPVLSFLACNLFFFSTKVYKPISPSVKYFRKETIREIMAIGSKFFIIQASGLIIYSTDNILISHFLGANQVSEYNVAFRYFSIPMYAFNIILVPYWSMTTNAVNQGDYGWIRNTIKKLLGFWGLFLLAGIVMLIGKDYIYRLWLNGKVVISLSLAISLLIYGAVLNLGGIFNTLMYGMNKINTIFYLSIAGVLVNIPLTILLIKETNLSLLSIPVAYTIYGIIATVIVSLSMRKVLSPANEHLFVKS